MGKYNLLQNLQHPTPQEEPKSSISYQQYDLIIGQETQCVLIPVRECENFEQSLETVDELTSDILRDILRKYRGIKNTK